MTPKLKNIIVFIIIAVIIILLYFFFLNKKTDDRSLISSEVPSLPVTVNTNMNTNIANINFNGQNNDELSQNFLSILLGVKSITLDDSIFKSDSPFFTLVDSSIFLTQDGTEGRTNPFAPIGVDVINTPPPSTTPASNSPSTTNSTNPANKPN